MSRETRKDWMDRIMRDRKTGDRIKMLNTHEIVDLVHSHEDQIYQLFSAMEAVEEYLDDRADADQPSGCDHPIANDEMRLLVIVRAALEKARQ